AWNRDQVVALRVHPGECQLRCSDAEFPSQSYKLVHQVQIAGEVLRLEARRALTEVNAGEFFRRPNRARQQAATQWARRNEGHPELTRGRQDLRFHMPL